ncbi:MAG: EVE domain-containing protein [Verrucomicrobiales bacterium]
MIKTEPASYSWADFVDDGKTAWTGVRNFQARNNLAAMRRGDLALFYHSVTEKAAVGIAKVLRQAYRDPTSADERWVCVDVAPVRPLNRPVTLEEIKRRPLLKDIALVRNSRLSVIPLTTEEFEEIVRMSKQAAR